MKNVPVPDNFSLMLEKGKPLTSKHYEPENDLTPYTPPTEAKFRQMRIYNVPEEVAVMLDALAEEVGLSRNQFMLMVMREIAGYGAPHVSILPCIDGELVVAGKADNDWRLQFLRVSFERGWGYLTPQDRHAIAFAQRMVFDGKTKAQVRAYLEDCGYKIKEVK